MAETWSLEPAGGKGHAEIPIGAGRLPLPFRALLSLRSAGDLRHEPAGPVPARRAFLQRLGIDPARVYACRQVHSRRVLTVSGGTPAAGGPADSTCGLVTGGVPADYAAVEADGLITRLPGVWLAVTVADCLPIWLAERAVRRAGGRPAGGGTGGTAREGAARALVHSGWQGTGIVREAIRRLHDEFGVPPEALAVTIGPGIGPCCYAVPEQRFAAFRAEFGPAAAFEAPEAGSPERRYRLDLRAANLRILEEEGVRDVRVIGDCTACTPSLSSYRRDGAEACGRMLALIGVDEEE